MDASTLHILTFQPSNQRVQNTYPGLCSEAVFLHRIQIERQRSERTGHPFSYIRIAFTERAFRTNTGEYAIFLQRMLDVLWENKDTIDMNGCLRTGELHLLLVHTKIQDAKQFIEQSLKKVMEQSRIAKIASEYKLIRRIEVAMHPVSNTPHCAYIKGRPIVARNIIWTLNEKKESVIEESFRLVPHWSNPNGGFISLKTPIMENGYGNLNGLRYRFVKRSIDFIGAGLFLLSFILPILAISLWVKCTSKGPVLFIQERVGQYAKIFKFLKFRSMHTNMDDKIHQDYVKKLIQGKNSEIDNGDESNPVYKLVDDPRITPAGKWLRKLSLDEIPQMWNVLVGQMSLVGPRPPIPYEVKEYKDWHYHRIAAAKPGITGLWQVYGRNSTTFEEMVRLDIRYVEKWSLLLDIKILFKTIKAVLCTEGS